MKFETDVLGRANYAEERKNHATTRSRAGPGKAAATATPLGLQVPESNAFEVENLFLAPLL